MSTDVAVATKTCTQCGREQPIDEFRFQRKKKGIRHPQCDTCFNSYHRDRTARDRQRDLKTYVQGLASDPSDPASFGVSTRSEAVVKAMLTRFGGLERFADDWFKFLKLAHLAGKHHIVQRSFEAMLKLLNVVDVTHENRQKSLDAMNEEELRSFIGELMLQRLWGNPEVAVVVLEEMGWTLIPPDAEKQRALDATVVGHVQQRLLTLLRIPTSGSHASELLLDGEDNEMELDDSDGEGDDLFDDNEFALFAARETREANGGSF